MKRTAIFMLGAAMLNLAACSKKSNDTPQPSTNPMSMAKGGSGSGGGTTTIPTPTAPSVSGLWLGDNRWGSAVTDARHWSLTLSQSGTAFTGRLETTMTSETGAKIEGEGNITVNGTLSMPNISFTMRPKRGGSVSTFIGTLSADGRTMRGVNWVPTVPATILGDTMTLVKQ